MRGFSMIEVLVSSILVASLMSALVWILNYASLLWIQVHHKNVLIIERVALLDAIENELMTAKTVSVPAVGASDDWCQVRSGSVRAYDGIAVLPDQSALMLIYNAFSAAHVLRISVPR